MRLTKREQILETAMRLFIEKGIHGTATSLIAREAGVATGTLFHHFPSKEDLVHALYHSIYGSLLEYQQRDLKPGEDVRERLRRQWQLDIEWGTNHVEEFHFLERYSFLYYASESAINEIFDRFQHCHELFSTAIAERRLKSDDLDYIREHFIWNIRMNISFFIANPQKCTPEAIEQSFEIYWKGICHES